MKKILISFVAIFVIAFGFHLSRVNAAPIGNYVQLAGGYIKSQKTSQVSPVSVLFDAWIYPTDTSNYHHIISVGDKSTKALHYNFGLNGGSLALQMRYGNSSQIYLSGGNVQPNVWSHVKASISSSSVQLFVNDSTVISSSGASPLLPLSSNIIVGSSYDESMFGNDYFKGNIDEVSISQNGSSLLVWHLDETRGGVTVNDASGNGFNGILSGGDSKVHFFGILPTATPYSGIPFPTSRFVRPTISFPTISVPTGVIIPTVEISIPPDRLDITRPPRPSR